MAIEPERPAKEQVEMGGIEEEIMGSRFVEPETVEPEKPKSNPSP